MRVADKIELDAQAERQLRILSKRRRIEARVQQRATDTARGARDRVAHRQHDAAREAGRGHPLEHAHPGRTFGAERHDHRPRVAAQRAQAASAGHLQAVARSALCRQGGRRRGPVPQSARARPCAQLRREEPDPGAQPHPAGPADEARACRHDDPRLPAQRHDHPCRAQHPGRHGHLDVPGSAPARRVAQKTASSATASPAWPISSRRLRSTSSITTRIPNR